MSKRRELPTSARLFGGDLDTSVLAVDGARVDLLAGLLDRLEDRLVVEAGLSDDDGFLLLEGDFVVLDTFFRRIGVSVCSLVTTTSAIHRSKHQCKDNK